MENLNTFMFNMVEEMKSASIDVDNFTMNEKLLFLYANCSDKIGGKF